MRIYIHYNTIEEPWGGINSFFKAFKHELNLWNWKGKEGKISIVDTPEDCDIFLMGANSCGKKKQIDIAQIKRFKTENPSMKIVHRVDGARSVYTDDLRHLDSDMKIHALAKLADWVVFQSKDSFECFSKLGYSGDNYSVIHNGVNQKIFSLGERKRFWKQGEPLKILAASWSNNLNKGASLISDLSTLKDVSVIFVGNWPKEIPMEKVTVFQAVGQEELVYFYRNAHVFFHGAKNDPCPNVVLEALSCSCPVIYHPSGGTKEIAYNYGIPLAKDENRGGRLRTAVDSMKENYLLFTNKILLNINTFSIEIVINQYLNIFRTLQEKKEN